MDVAVIAEERYWYPEDGGEVWLAGYTVVDPRTGAYLARDAPELVALGLRVAVIAGIMRPEPAVEELVATLGGCLRAILRDVLCGHLDPDLRRVADDLLADAAPAESFT